MGFKAALKIWHLEILLSDSPFCYEDSTLLYQEETSSSSALASELALKRFC